MHLHLNLNTRNMERQSELRTMHLFAGAGGGILGDLILGHQPIVAVEWDNYCCNVLRERVADGWFEGMHVWEGDVSVFDPSEYEGRVDCIHAGFPCQDISFAGKQAGVDSDTRSGLYREVLRIADVVRPQYIFLENVAAIVTGNDGGWLRTVVGDLAQRGFDATWTCLSAAEVGANHVRNRWWLLAYPSSVQQPNGINGGITEGSEAATPEGLQPSSRSGGIRNVPIQRWRTAENQRKGNVANTHLPGGGAQENDSDEGRTKGDQRREKQSLSESSRQSSAERASNVPNADGEYWGTRQRPEQSERGISGQSSCDSSALGDTSSVRSEAGLSEPEQRQEGQSEVAFNRGDRLDGWQGGSWWSLESDVGRVAHGVPSRTHRLKALGNGQVPLQAAAAFDHLWKVMKLKTPDTGR